MDVMDEALLEFWKKLNDNGVKYIMVGGLATRFHGYNRATDDLDMWIEDTIVNRKKLRKAFIDLEYGDYESIETMQFIAGWTSFYAAGIELDIMTEMKGLEEFTFDECFALVNFSQLNEIQIPFLHINHLIANKKAVNRPKDRLDVIYLEKIKTLLENQNNPQL
jgi:predicted nucleotidyltransferase